MGETVDSWLGGWYPNETHREQWAQLNNRIVKTESSKSGPKTVGLWLKKQRRDNDSTASLILAQDERWRRA